MSSSYSHASDTVGARPLTKVDSPYITIHPSLSSWASICSTSLFAITDPALTCPPDPLVAPPAQPAPPLPSRTASRQKSIVAIIFSEFPPTIDDGRSRLQTVDCRLLFLPSFLSSFPPLFPVAPPVESEVSARCAAPAPQFKRHRHRRGNEHSVQCDKLYLWQSTLAFDLGITFPSWTRKPNTPTSSMTRLSPP